MLFKSPASPINFDPKMVRFPRKRTTGRLPNVGSFNF